MSTTPPPSPSPLAVLQATPRRRKSPYASRTPTPAPSPAPGAVAASVTWPRLQKTVPLQAISDATQAIFGYPPRSWQLQTMCKVLEGHDAIVIAGTGAGKSLLFVLLAIAAELAGVSGTIIVICPLKALQMDQVRRLNGAPTDTSTPVATRICLRAIAINEDNRDEHEQHFVDLERGRVRLCYASPECLLRNNAFKQLFRKQEFRRRILANIVDEALEWAEGTLR